MATFVVLNGDRVENILVADTKEIAELVSGLICVEYTSDNPAVIGETYDGSIFTNPITE
jgi:hypothetical protein